MSPDNTTHFLQDGPINTEEVVIGRIPLRIFADIVKNVKNRLPKACSFLAPFKTLKGEYQVLAIVNKEELLFTTPALLKFTSADIEELHSVLLDKC